MDYLPLIMGLGIAAGFAGLLAGFLGVGGGIVLVPAMFWMFEIIDFPKELSMHMAVATSLATIIFTAISSARAHHLRGGVDTVLLRRWSLPMGLGALAGGLLARFADADALKAIFGCVGILVAVNFCLPRPVVLADRLPGSRPLQGTIAGAIGLVSSLMGIGGGTLGVPTLTAFSYNVQKAVGTAAAFGLVIAVPAALGFVISGWDVPERPAYSLGYVSIPAVLAIIPITVTMAPQGAKLAYLLDTKWIKYGFALFLWVTSLRMLSGVFA